jgi:hypothetical protein
VVVHRWTPEPTWPDLAGWTFCQVTSVQLRPPPLFPCARRRQAGSLSEPAP